MDSTAQWILLAVGMLTQLGLFAGGVRALARLVPGVQLEIWDGFFGLLVISLMLELAGFSGMMAGRALFCLGMAVGLSQTGARLARGGWRRGVVPLLLFAGFFGLWAWWLGKLLCIPSIGDGAHHLYFYSRIRETGQMLVGRIHLLHEGLFGPQRMEYYPTGFHAAVAIATYPLSALLRTHPSTELQVAAVALLAYFPVAMYGGLRRALPNVVVFAALASALWVGSLQLFPMNPLGEGGISRIAGHILAVPVVWKLLSEELTPGMAFFLGAISFPVLFWIHPSSVVVPGVVALVRMIQQRKSGAKSLLLGGIGLLLGGVLAWKILRSGWAELEHPGVVQDFFAVQRLGAHAAWDRIKGPVQHILSDPAGYGKFLSPRSLFFYLGLGLILSGSSRRMELTSPQWRGLTIALFILPFTLSFLMFVNWVPAIYLGLFFYHSVVRFSELGFWPLFLGWAVGLAWVWGRIKGLAPARARFCQIVIVLIVVSSAMVGLMRLSGSLDYFNGLYVSPVRENVAEMLKRFEAADAPSRVWVCDDPATQALLVSKGQALENRFFVLGTDCYSHLISTDHCKKRAEFISVFRSRPGVREVPLLDPVSGSQARCWVSDGMPQGMPRDRALGS